MVRLVNSLWETAVLFTALLMLCCVPAAAKRVALVIGNAAYTQGPLANPVNDADAVAEALGGLGFAKVIRANNATKARMEAALAELAAEAAGAEMAVVYFAGHGTERDGRNYLIPIDAKLDRASDLDLQAIALPTVLDQIARATRLKLVILDACRNNVFPLAGNRRSAARGLARIEPEDNTIVAFAAKDGTVALDSTGGRHSPFTAALLKHIATPGLEVRFLLAEVRDEVVAATQRQQTPHIYGTLGRDRIYLKQAAIEPTMSSVATTGVPSIQGKGDLSPVEAAERERWIAELNRDAGKVFRDCAECPEMVIVRSGSFTMGSHKSEEWHARNEGPQRMVTIAQPFAVGKFEVTFAEWAACVASDGCTSNRNPGDQGWGRGRRPVINVSWDDAKEYAAWLSRKTGKTYRLLSEAEWEYAARAGTTTPFSTGQTISTSQANFNSDFTYGGSATGQYRQQTVEVGSFAANQFGLHDMHGNVWEWVEDCYADNYNGTPSNGSAATEAPSCRRLLRGGSWDYPPGNLRSAVRMRGPMNIQVSRLGLRVARTLAP